MAGGQPATWVLRAQEPYLFQKALLSFLSWAMNCYAVTLPKIRASSAGNSTVVQYSG